MRSTTKTIVGLASLGVLAASYKFGIEAPAAFANQDALTSLGSNTSQTTDSNNTDAPAGGSSNGNSESGNGSTTDNTGGSTSGSSSGSSGASGSSSGSSGSGSSGSSGSGSSSGSNSGSSGSNSSSGSGSSSGSSGSSGGSGNSSGSGGSGSSSGGSTSGGSSSSTSVIKTGDSVRYRFGTIQVQVTKVDGQITDITLLQAGATGGRSAAFSYLVDYAIQAQGSNFGNISGATYTTAAFVQSLDSALAQF